MVSYGPDVNRLKTIINDNGLDVSLVNARFIKPIDKRMCDEISKFYDTLIIIEQSVNNGSLYTLMNDYYSNESMNVNIKSINFDVDQIIPHGKTIEVLDNYGFSNDDLINKIKKYM